MIHDRPGPSPCYTLVHVAHHFVVSQGAALLVLGIKLLQTHLILQYEVVDMVSQRALRSHVPGRTAAREMVQQILQHARLCDSGRQLCLVPLARGRQLLSEEAIDFEVLLPIESDFL